ncbi:MAG: sulfotransferase domain-containing protein [Pseudomonadota bacterium]
MDKLLIGLGAMKSATTWLTGNLNRSPQVFVPPVKEIHYFHGTARNPDALGMYQRLWRQKNRLAGRGRACGHFLSQRYRQDRALRFMDHIAGGFDKLDPALAHTRLMDISDRAKWFRSYLSAPVDDAWYRSLFPADGEDIWSLDFSNTTCLLKPRDLERAANMAATTRAIMILRNPYDRLWSHVRFNAQVRGETDLIETYGPKQLHGYVRTHGLIRHSLYHNALRRALDVFGKDRLMVINFDDIARRPVVQILAVQEFLGIDRIPGAIMAREKRNVSTAHAMPPNLFARHRALFAKDLAGVAKLGYGFVESWADGPTEVAAEPST